MGVHPIARAGFGAAPDAYERGRPEYPKAAICWLSERLGLRPGQQEREGLLSRVRELARPGTVVLRYTCEVQVTRSRLRGG